METSHKPEPEFTRTRDGILKYDSQVNLSAALEYLNLRFVDEGAASDLIGQRFGFRPPAKAWSIYRKYQTAKARLQLARLRYGPDAMLPSPARSQAK